MPVNIKLNTSRITAFCLLAFIGGIGTGSFLPPFEPWQVKIPFVLACLLFAAFALISQKPRKHYFLIGAFLILGIWRIADVQLRSDAASRLKPEVTPVFKARVITDPQIRESSSRFIVEALEPSMLSQAGRIQVDAMLYPEYRYGDVLELKCRLKKPDTKGSYESYLAAKQIYWLCYHPETKLISRSENQGFYSMLFQVKERIRKSVSRGMKEPEAGLANAFLLGTEGTVDKNIKDFFSKAGTTHLIAISGLNITIISATLMGFFIFLGFWRKQAFYLAAITLAAYLVMIGAPASALRAGIMGFLVLFSQYLGRTNNISRSILWAAGIMLAISPRALADDIGFQLSFLAILGIIYIYPIMAEKYASWMAKNRLIGFILNNLFITIAAQLTTIPVICYNFGIISPIALLSNLLTVWLSPYLLIALFFGIICGLILPGLLIYFFFIAYYLLEYLILVSKLAAELPYSHFYFTNTVLFFWLFYYLLLVALLVKYYSNFSQKKLLLNNR